MTLDADKVHKGSGKIFFNGGLIGDATSVAFILQKLGLSGSGDAEHTAYGTVSGWITKKEVIATLNNPHPTPSELHVVLEEDASEIKLLGVEFIDDIPASGELDEVEFDGTLED